MESLNSTQIRQQRKHAVWDGIFGSPLSVMSGGALLTGYALYLGASPFEISVIMAMPFLTQLVQIFAPGLIDRIGSRRKVAAYGLLFHRLIWLLLGTMPVMMVFALDPIPLFITLLASSLILFNLGQNGWLVWMADLIPADYRGRFFGRRNLFIGISSMVFLLGAGILLDLFTGYRMEGFGYSILIILGAGCGYFSFRKLLLMEDRTPVDGEQLQLRILFRHLRTEHRFRSVLGFVAFWTVSTGIAAPFYFVHMYENLAWSYNSVTMYAAISGGLQLLLQPLWGHVLDRFGHKPVLQASIGGVSIVPLIWIFMAKPWSYWLWGEAVLSGTLWAGINIALFNIALYALPMQKKAPAMAVFSMIIGFVNFLAMILGGILVSLLEPVAFNLGEWRFSPFHLVFFLSFLGRILSTRFVLAIDEPDAKTLGVVAYHMTSGLVKRVNLGRQFWVFRGNGRDK